MVDLSPRQHKIQIASGLLIAILIFAALVAIPQYSSNPLNQLDTIKQQGFIRFLMLNSASTYYQGPQGPNGFEYQLAKLYAEHIGVELKIHIVDEYANIYPELLFNSGDIAAAGLSEQDIHDNPSISFGPGYHSVKQQVLYRKGLYDRPKSIEDLSNGVLEVIQGTSHTQLLEGLKKKYPKLRWNINNEMATEELIELVDEGLVDFMLADSHEIALQRRFYPELRIAFELGRPKQLRWAYKNSTDKSLEKSITEFFNLINQDGRLEQLKHRHFSHVAKFNYSDLQTFAIHARDRLPKYRDMFIQEAKALDMDWRLLAAIGYQESLWNEKAKSPTGVRGLMMLTLDTAKHVKISNRLDPVQSIRGGAKYFKQIQKRLPQRITQPDRNWLALASYNVGLGHLEDARIITMQNKGDPDKWIDVKDNLPLLGKKKWYKKTKHGYARGWEPVKYVENIRKYYDLLVWMDSRNNEPEQEPEEFNEGLSIPPSF